MPNVTRVVLERIHKTAGDFRFRAADVTHTNCAVLLRLDVLAPALFNLEKFSGGYFSAILCEDTMG